jgi:pectate lyase
MNLKFTSYRVKLGVAKSRRAAFEFTPPALKTCKFLLFNLMIVVLVFVSPNALAGVPAFPGAEGGGSLAIGGRGGVVCEVTNLNDTGRGSLRSCSEMSGPRTVIFRVGGTIFLHDQITITNPYITIAGQTAPGDGIQIASASDNQRNLISVRTHDVIIRYVRMRHSGDVTSKAGILWLDNAGSTSVHSVIFDHLSLFWSPETATGVWGQNLDSHRMPPKDVTWQNTIIAESLARHSTAVNIGARRADINEAMTDIDFHNNLFANNGHRNPLLKNASGRFNNNIVYNWTFYATRAGTGSHRDFIANIWKSGPLAKNSSAGEFELGFLRWTENLTNPDYEISSRPNSFYVAGNRGDLTGMSPESDNWPYTREIGSKWESGVRSVPAPIEWRRNAPLPPKGVPITIRPVTDLENHLLPIVGASRRLDCEGNWVLTRDAADLRIIEQYRTNRGLLVTHEDDVGGLPRVAGGVPCADASRDGIPDAWLVKYGLDPNDPIGPRIHNSGYSFLELYLNGMELAEKAAPDAPQGVVIR